MRSRQRRTTPPAGFTLIELMMVVAIVGILAAIAVPGMVGSLNKQRAISSAKDVPDFVQRTRGFARLTGCETILNVSNSGSTFTLTYATVETDVSLPCGTLNGLAKSFRNDISLSAWTLSGAPLSDVGLVFNGNGGTELPGEAQLTVTNALSGSTIIKVWPFIGSIEVIR